MRQATHKPRRAAATNPALALQQAAADMLRVIESAELAELPIDTSAVRKINATTDALRKALSDAMGAIQTKPPANTPGQRPRPDIQAAHDVLHAELFCELPDSLDPLTVGLCQGLHDALGWVLGLPCGSNADETLRKIVDCAERADQGRGR